MGLLDGENEVLRLKPHILSRAWAYIFWIFCFGTTYLFATDSILLEQAYRWVSTHPQISVPMKFLSLIPRIVAWSLIITAPICLISLLKLQWGILVRFLFILATAIGLRFLELGPGIEHQAMCFISIGAILYLELTRWSTQYVITNQRLILEHKGWKNTTRTLFFSKINDLVLAQNFWGKLFQYGSIIPMTASGLGMGSAESSIHIGAGGGSGILSGKVEGGLARSVQEAAETSEYAIFCVPNPRRVYDLILRGMQGQET